MAFDYHLLRALEPLSVGHKKRDAGGTALVLSGRAVLVKNGDLVALGAGRSPGGQGTRNGVGLKAVVAHHPEDALPNIGTNSRPVVEHA
jgi:hypothetical protein